MNIYDQVITSRAALYNGDCVHVMSGMPSDSVGFSIDQAALEPFAAG